MAGKHLSEILHGVTRFGRLTVLGEAEPYMWRGRRCRMALCQCDCGAIKSVQPAKLNHRVIVSCGCHAAEIASRRLARHRMTGSPEYRSWASMRNRCYREADVAYADYGGRGIAVCDRWRKSFESFYADMGPRPNGTTLDRIDVNGNYEPGNCRWATPAVQADNRRDNYHIAVGGEVINLAEAARRSGLRQSSLRSRLDRGMSPEEAMTKPRDKTQGARSKSNNHRVLYQGRELLLVELTEETGIEGSHLRYHLKRGRTADEAVALILAKRKTANA